MIKTKFMVSALALLASGIAYASEGPSFAKNTFYVGMAHVAVHSEMAPLSGDINYPSPGATFKVGSASTAVFGWEHYFTEKCSTELVLGVPPTHSSYGQGVFGSVGEMSRVDEIAPTVFANYRFTNVSKKFIPMFGIGLNYTKFVNAKATPAAEAAAHGSVKIHNSDYWGLAYQIGMEYKIDKHWSLMAKVMKSDVKSDLTVTMTNPYGTFVDKSTIKFNPIVTSFTTNYSF